MILTSKINAVIYDAVSDVVYGAVGVGIYDAVFLAVDVGIYDAVSLAIYDAVDNAVSVNDIFSDGPVNGTVGVLPQLIAWTKRQFRR